MLIAFVHTGKAFLPGINAYSGFFARHGINTTTVLETELKNIKADVEWHFMGTHFRQTNKSAVIIHEYASASVPPFAGLKNKLKNKFNIRPDFRLFLNSYVKERLHFTDSTPFGYRDLGLDQEFLDAPVQFAGVKKEYDFIYSGSTTPDLQIQKLLSHFARVLKEKSILILSRNYQYLAKKYKTQRNIFFTGPVEQSEVPAYIRKAKFAINFKPDIEPHNQQTATKLMEYAACKVPVITSDFAWVRKFEEEYGGRFFYLNTDLSNLQWDNITEFPYSFPDLRGLTWESQIRKSGVLDFLAVKFPDIRW